MPETAVIAGVGPGFCEQFAWKLAEEGYSIGMFARSTDYLNELEEELRKEGFEACGIPVDITDPEEVNSGFNQIHNQLGQVEVLAHTASIVTDDTPVEIDPDRFEQMWRLYAHGALLCFREIHEDLLKSQGTALFFGAFPEAGDFAFKSGKDALRGLARSLENKYGPEGIHVAHVIIDGLLLNPGVYDGVTDINEEEYIDPEATAQTCYHLIEQPVQARTFELDLHAKKRTSIR